jgi:hypothetical protein
MKNKDIYAPVVKTLFIPEGNPGVQEINEIVAIPVIKNAEGETNRLTITGDMEISISYLPVLDTESGVSWKNDVDLQEGDYFGDNEETDQVLSCIEQELRKDQGQKQAEFWKVVLNVPFTLDVEMEPWDRGDILRIEPELYSKGWYVLNPQAVEFEAVLKLRGDNQETVSEVSRDMIVPKEEINEKDAEASQIQEEEEKMVARGMGPDNISGTENAENLFSPLGADDHSPINQEITYQNQVTLEEEIRGILEEEWDQETAGREQESPPAENTEDLPGAEAEERSDVPSSSGSNEAEDRVLSIKEESIEDSCETKESTGEQEDEVPLDEAEESILQPETVISQDEEKIDEKIRESVISQQVKLPDVKLAFQENLKKANIILKKETQIDYREEKNPAGAAPKEDNYLKTDSYTDKQIKTNKEKDYFCLKFYRVQEGEDLDAIADKLGVSKDIICRVNYISEEEIRTGMLLTIPAGA